MFERHTVKTNVFTCPSLYTGCASTHFTRRRMESFMCVIQRVFEQQYIDIHVDNSGIQNVVHVCGYHCM